MPGMYDMVSESRKRPKRRLSAPLLAALAAALVLIAVWIFSICMTLMVRPRFMRFVSELSDSTTYAYENDFLRADMDGASIRVKGDNVYSVYQALTAWTPKKLLRSAPGEAADVVLDYGDGARVLVWGLNGADTGGKSGICVRFEGKDGSSLVFWPNSTDLSAVKRCVLQEGNEAWEDAE